MNPKRLTSEQIEEDFNAAHLSAEEFASGYGEDADTIPEDDEKFDLASLDSDEDILPEIYHDDDEDIEAVKKASRH